jgi:hypothetical protein
MLEKLEFKSFSASYLRSIKRTIHNTNTIDLNLELYFILLTWFVQVFVRLTIAKKNKKLSYSYLCMSYANQIWVMQMF